MRLSSLHIFSESDQIAWVGAGGKTSLIFSVAKELFKNKCLITTTTKMASSELSLADHTLIINNPDDVNIDHLSDITLIYRGLADNEKTKISGYEEGNLIKLSDILYQHKIPFMIEADGSKRKPGKFPGKHEPNIPSFINKVCVVVGLSAIGKPLTQEYFHRPEEIAKVLDIALGEEIKVEHIFSLLTHKEGGLKNIPGHAEKILFLHQADCLVNPHEIDTFALKLKDDYEHVILSSIHENSLEIVAHWGKIGCVVLAAGSGSRFGGPKQLAQYKQKTFIENVIETTFKTNFQKRVIVLGSYYENILPVIDKYKISALINEDWNEGQSTSVKLGVSNFLEDDMDAILFLLVDQPQITTEMINNILNLFAYTKNSIIVHLYEGQNRHPILFAENTFQDLMNIQGDQGGRQLFKKYPPLQIKIENDYLAFDIDTVNDLKNL